MNKTDLDKALRYDRDSGILFWKKRDISEFKNEHDMNCMNTKFHGKPAGSINNKGYLIIHFSSGHILSHRAIFIMEYGYEPKLIDHIDGNRINNKIDNLREVDYIGNSKNKGISKRNKTGHLGVCWHKTKKKYQSNIRVNWKLIHLGTFSDIKDAIKARKEAEEKYGFHENHGKRISYNAK